MDAVKHKLTQNQEIFFDNMSRYIDEELYFYGSIKRSDYIKGKSDIDIDIFTENEYSTIQKLCHFLNVKRYEFKKVIYKTNNTLVYGHKIKYNNPEKQIDAEISVYNNKYKSLVLYDHNNESHLPLYITIVLYIVKFLHYNLGILSSFYYKRCKRFLMNPDDEQRFILMDG